MPASDPDILARIALDAVGREYPNAPQLRLQSPADLVEPRQLHPAFFGSFDWHSAVHGHWALVRLARCEPDADFVPEARRVVCAHMTPDALRAEQLYFQRNPSFERPYGVAWLMLLEAELLSPGPIDLPAPARAALRDLCAEVSGSFDQWLAQVPFPIRSGQHGQTSFALGMLIDAATATSNARRVASLSGRALSWHGNDRDLPVHLEPSGHDFLSPALGVADLMRRVLAPDPFAQWLDRAIPGLQPGHPHFDDTVAWLQPVRSPNRADGKLSHLDGLNLSRAWMLKGTADGLPADDRRQRLLRHAADNHLEAGLDEEAVGHYAGSHWLASFAVYALFSV